MADCSDAINSLVEAVEAIEYELGISPSTVYSNVRARLDILESRINNPFAPSPNVDNPFLIGSSGVSITVGAGIPSASAQIGSLYLRNDGYFNQVLYTRGSDAAWHLLTPNRFVNNVTVNFGTISAASIATQPIAILGAKVGENVIVNPRLALPNSIQIDYCRVSAADTVELRLYNRSGVGISVNQSFDVVVIPNS